MFVVRLADVNICIENKYDYVEKLCCDYVTSEKPDFSVFATNDEIMAENVGGSMDAGYLESLAIYRKIAENMIKYNAFLLHASVIDVDGAGVAFLAKSGVGKTTHTRLWQELYKDRVTVVNGDKPLVKFVGDKIFAFGTPWSGKENLQKNTKTELQKICFIERCENNCCVPLGKEEAFERLINQIYMPKNRELFLKTLEYRDLIIKKSQFYLIRCNTDISSAEISYKGIGL